jgi:hypothetical protein
VGAFAGGQETPVSGLPKTGTATYAGEAVGNVVGKNGGFTVIGNSNLTANFGSGSVSGLFNGFTALPGGSVAAGAPFSDIAASANLSGSNAHFTGTAQTLNSTAISQDALTGSIKGSFFGDAAQEVGGTMALKGSSTAAVIGFGAAKK